MPQDRRRQRGRRRADGVHHLARHSRGRLVLWAPTASKAGTAAAGPAEALLARGGGYAPRPLRLYISRFSVSFCRSVCLCLPPFHLSHAECGTCAGHARYVRVTRA
jgi:hypothetical protein